jgi:NAD(P)H-hydrate repair Nnr-like enzyme with NAD(P)H-hydrate dehydratase domain
VHGVDFAKASAIARHLGQSVLVKGSLTMVVDPSGTTWALPAATPWLATAGTGDALAGIIGALVAANAKVLGENPALMAQVGAVGAVIHHRAAALAAKVLGHGIDGGGPITPSDLCEQIPGVIAQILAS